MITSSVTFVDTVQICLRLIYIAGFSATNGNSLTQQFWVFLPDSSAFLNGKPSEKGKLVLCKFGSFQWTSCCHCAMQCQLLQLEQAEQHKIRNSGSKQKPNFFWNFLQKKYVRSGKIISTKCCWRHPSSNIFMVHWRSRRKGGICSENGKSLPQSHPDIRSETQQQDFRKSKIHKWN